MAARYQGPAQSLVRGGAGARRGRHPDPSWRTVAPAPPRQRGGLARGRAPFDRRAQVLPLELADRDAAKNPRRHHQGALALRADPSAAQGGTWPRSLRRAILERSASPRSHEYGRLPLSAAPATRSGETRKKTGSARRLSRAYPRYAPRSSRSSTPAVADDVPSGPGTRQSSTRIIYQSSASLREMFWSMVGDLIVKELWFRQMLACSHFPLGRMQPP